MRSEQRASGSGGGADSGRAAPTHLPPELHPAPGHAPRSCAGQERSVVEPEPKHVKKSEPGPTVPEPELDIKLCI